MKINNLYATLCEETIEVFEEDVIGFFRSHSLSDSYRKGKASRTRIEELFEPIFNLIIEEVAEVSNRIASEEKMFTWEEN